MKILVKILIMALVLVSVACQKKMFPIAMTDEPTDNPQYSEQ